MTCYVIIDIHNLISLSSGGVVTIAVDTVSLGEAAELDDQLQTVDDLGAYVANDIELDDVAERYGLVLCCMRAPF